MDEQKPPLPHAVLWHGRPIQADDALLESLTSELVQPIDLAIVDGHTLSAAELRALRQFAQQSPHVSPYKCIFIQSADELSPTVANGLLKLIEEPPNHLLIRLAATHLEAVLPTIRSRCQLVFIGHGSAIDSRYSLAEIGQMTRTEQFALAETLARDEALPAIVTHWLSDLEVLLLQGHSVGASIAAGQTLVEALRTNINRRLALEAWFLNHASASSTEGLQDA